MNTGNIDFGHFRAEKDAVGQGFKNMYPGPTQKWDTLLVPANNFCGHVSPARTYFALLEKAGLKLSRTSKCSESKRSLLSPVDTLRLKRRAKKDRELEITGFKTDVSFSFGDINRYLSMALVWVPVMRRKRTIHLSFP